MARFYLSDEEWAVIEPLLPPRRRRQGGRPRTEAGDRQVLNGIFYVLRTGCPWRDPSERHGPPTTVYNRFNRWAKQGVWVHVFEALTDQSPPLHAPDRLFHRPGASTCGGRKKGDSDHALGRSRGGLSTKINAVVDEAGRPVRIVFTPGQAPDKAAVADMLRSLPPARNLVADQGYDARAIVDLVRAHGTEPHIPTQRDRKVQRSVSATLYRERNLVERFFNRLKQFRKIATRYEQTARNFLAAILIASSRIWLRYESVP